MKVDALTLDSFLDNLRPRVLEAVDRHLPPPAGEENGQLVEAMRYTVLAGGKLFRPSLCLLACHAVGGDPLQAVDCAVALEFVHAYSLIHDDLPAMDDADLRRGRPSSHKAFGEAMAILAGDGLLTLAFEVLGASYPEKGGRLVLELARGAGFQGMVAGQAADIRAPETAPTAETVSYIHRNKTGALIVASLRTGGLVGGAEEKQLAALTTFGENVGLAFQVVDDVIDTTVEESDSGKTAGGDAEAGKVTYPAVYGLDDSRRIALELTDSACETAAALARPDLLVSLARHIVRRVK